MAIKVGEREVGTSIASLQQRRGVTPAYTGDALSSALTNIGDTIDVFQKRASELLDIEYRADANMKATTFLNDLEKKHRLDPSAFMKAAESYLETSINQAPDRYKGWTKGLLSPMIAQRGDVIWGRWNNIQQQEKKELFEQSHVATMEDIRNSILNMDISQIDEFILGSDGKTVAGPPDAKYTGIALQKIGENYELYSKLYNSLDPQYRSDMLMPEEWLKQQKLYVEGARMESVVMTALEGAAAADLNNYYNNPLALGFKEEDLLFNKTYKEVVNALNTYIKNPNAMKSDIHGKSILTDSLESERGAIAEQILGVMKSAKAKSDAAYVNYSNFQKLNADKALDDVNVRIDNFNYDILSLDEYTLSEKLKQLNVSDDEMMRIVDAHTANKEIYNSVLELAGDTSKTNLNNISMTKMNKFAGNGNTTYENSDQIKTAMVDAMVVQSLLPVIEHTTSVPTGPAQLGYTKQQKITEVPEFTDLYSIDLFEVDENGTLKYSEELGKINQIISVHNHIPTVVKHAFGNAAYLDIKNPNDFNSALELGKLAESITNRNYYPDNLSEQEILQMDNWASFYRRYNALDFTDKNTEKYLDAAEGYLQTVTNPNANNFYSAVTNSIETNYNFSLFDSESNQIDVAGILKNYMNEGPEVHDEQLLSIYDYVKMGDIEMNDFLRVIKDPFAIVLSNDIKNKFATGDVNINNITNENFMLPTEFTTEEYILKTLKKAMKIRNYDGWSIM